MAKHQNFFILFIIIAVIFSVEAFESEEVDLQANGWKNAHATFYGDIKGGETMRKLIRHRDGDKARHFIYEKYSMEIVELTTFYYMWLQHNVEIC